MSPAWKPLPKLTEKVGVVSPVILSVDEVPVSLAEIKSGAPEVGEIVTVKVLVVVTFPSLTEMVIVLVPVLPAVGVMASEFWAFAGALVPVAPVPPVRTRPVLGIRLVLLLIMV